MPAAASAARRAPARTNVHMEPGALSPAALIADIERGLYVTELIGQRRQSGDRRLQPRRLGLHHRERRDRRAGRRDHHRRQSPRHVPRARAGQRSGASPLGQRSDLADRRDDGRRCLRRSPGSPRRPAGSPPARCGTDYRSWEKAPGHPVCESTSRSTPSCSDELGALDPEAGWLSEETLDAVRPDRAAAALGGRSDRRHPRLSARPARLVRLGRPGRGPGAGARRAGGAAARRALDRRARARAAGATASGSGSARAPSWPAPGCPPTSCPRSTATWSRSPSPIRSRSASPWSRPARPICVATLQMGLRMGHRRRRPDRRGGGRDGQRRARPAARLQHRLGRGVRRARRHARHPRRRGRAAARAGDGGGLSRDAVRRNGASPFRGDLRYPRRKRRMGEER